MFTTPEFFKTGHRGCRGLYPENTTEGFLIAIQMGCNALELDIVVSKDNQLVVSHEPYMNPDFCLTTEGKEIHDEKKYNLYHMDYKEIKSFDCGLKPFPRFPKQQKVKAFKPLLSEVIDSCENFFQENDLPSVLYDIEIKSESQEYLISQPSPEVFAEMLATFIQQRNLTNKVIIRSFDPVPLRYLNKHHPEFRLALIVENQLSAEENILDLGFLPFMYSPEYVLLTKQDMDYLKMKDLIVVPWTVNTAEEIREMLHLEVDGIITDYPDLFKTMGL